MGYIFPIIITLTSSIAAIVHVYINRARIFAKPINIHSHISLDDNLSKEIFLEKLSVITSKLDEVQTRMSILEKKIDKKIVTDEINKVKFSVIDEDVKPTYVNRHDIIIEETTDLKDLYSLSRFNLIHFSGHGSDAKIHPKKDDIIIFNPKNENLSNTKYESIIKKLAKNYSLHKNIIFNVPDLLIDKLNEEYNDSTKKD